MKRTMIVFAIILMTATPASASPRHHRHRVTCASVAVGPVPTKANPHPKPTYSCGYHPAAKHRVVDGPAPHGWRVRVIFATLAPRHHWTPGLSDCSLLAISVASGEESTGAHLRLRAKVSSNGQTLKWAGNGKRATFSGGVLTNTGRHPLNAEASCEI